MRSNDQVRHVKVWGKGTINLEDVWCVRVRSCEMYICVLYWGNIDL